MTMYWNAETARVFSDAVSALRQALVQATTYDQAMTILCGVDLDVLRILEEEFHYLPTPTTGLRERIAAAHIRRLERGDTLDTSAVTARTVAGWAEGTLQEWLPGYTDFDEKIGGQYKVTQQTDGTYMVETTHGYGQRRFHVLVVVVEAA